jgi:hypothetical protein
MGFWVLLTLCKNSSLKPALRGFFSLKGTGGAAAAAARVGNPDGAVGCTAATDDTVAETNDGKSFVVAGLVIEVHSPSLPVSLTTAPILLNVGEQNS